MANRNFSSQFSFSFEKQVVKLMGTFTQVGSAGGRASLVEAGLTFTAVPWGAAGNDISVEFLDPAANNATLSVAVVGNAITVSLATDGTGAITSTYNDIAAAVTGDVSASALVTVTGSNSNVAIALAQTNLSAGADTVFTNNLPIATMTLTQTDDGVFTLELADKFYALISASVTLMTASAADLQPQLASEAVSTTKIIDLRTIAMGSGSPVLTNMSAGDKLLIDLSLRNVI